MIKKLLPLIVFVLFISTEVVHSNDDRTNRIERTHKVSDGSEIYENTNNYQPKFTSTHFLPFTEHH
ncbi:MAG: hypothetical protein IPM38_00870 [Ignavibacteria bacterium]|nr:hypothetical protein [Ignavibacteria bacterium]